jgi:hypothetical protein
MKEFLDLAIRVTAREAAGLSEMIDSIRGVEAFVVEEGRDQSGEAGTRAEPPGSCHLTDEEV